MVTLPAECAALPVIDLTALPWRYQEGLMPSWTWRSGNTFLTGRFVLHEQEGEVQAPGLRFFVLATTPF